MEGQQTLSLPTKKPFRTSNDAVFPSLHPFGPYYRHNSLLQKRTSEMLGTETETSEPVKKIHTASQPVTYKSPSYIPSPPQYERLESTMGLLNGFQYSPIKEQSLVSGLEYGLANIWENIIGANFTGNLQVSLMMEMMRQQMELLAQQVSQQTNTGIEKAKQLDTKLIISDSSTNESETEEEMKENQEEQQNGVSIIIAPLHQRQWNETNTIPQVPPFEKTGVDKEGSDENSKVVQPVSEPLVVEEDDGLMPGFTDKLKSPIVVDVNAQVVLPLFRIEMRGEEKKKVLKPMWEPEGGKFEKAEMLIDSLKEVLGFEITNQEKALKLLRDNDFIVERCMETVGKQKTKHKAEFKIKKLSLKKYR